MSDFDVSLKRIHGSIDGRPVEVWVASVDADAYGEGRGKTPGEALRHLADEFDVEFGALPRGNWKKIDGDVDLYSA